MSRILGSVVAALLAAGPLVAGCGAGDAGDSVPLPGGAASTATPTSVAADPPAGTDTIAVTDPASTDPAAAPWPPYDPTITVGAECVPGGAGERLVNLWSWDGVGTPEVFHTVDVSAALAPFATGDLSVGDSHCGNRVAWSRDYRKVLVYFRPDASVEAHHIAVVDVVAGVAQDLTAARQTDDQSFGAEVLDEAVPTFELVRDGQGRIRLNDDGVVFASVFDTAYDTVGEYSRLSLSDPAKATRVAEDDVVMLLDRRFDFGSSCLNDRCVSFDGRWVAIGRPGDTPPTIVAPWVPDEPDPEDPARATGITCARGIAQGWIPGNRLVLWDPSGTLTVATVADDGAVTCGRNLLPENDYRLPEQIVVDPAGSAVFLDQVGNAPATAYRVPLDGGEPEESEVPEAPEGVTFFFPAPAP